MRRAIGPLLVAIGAFCLAFAPLLKFYVADQVLAAPTDFYQMTVMRAQNAEMFSATKGKVATGLELAAVITTRADAKSSSDKIAVWDTFTNIKDPDSGQDAQIYGRRMAFDRRTGYLIDCCGSSVGQDPTVKQTGLGLLWPIGDVRKQSYPYFDEVTKRAWPMVYSGEAKVRGITAYRFEQDIPQTYIEAMPSLPPQTLGLDKKEPGVKADLYGNVEVDKYYRAKIIMWVDPRTGFPVAQEQRLKSTGYTKNRKGHVELLSADLKTTDTAEKALVERSARYAAQFRLVQGWGPMAALLLGMVLLGLGVLLQQVARRHVGAHTARVAEPADPPAAATRREVP